MDNISENELSVEMIAENNGISVSTLYRKVKALTDLNSVEYIRLVKLKKAAELLSEGNYRINEISYLVGFSSPSYFATSFQKAIRHFSFSIYKETTVRRILFCQIITNVVSVADLCNSPGCLNENQVRFPLSFFNFQSQFA